MGLIIVPLLFVYASLAYFITRKLSRVPKKQFHRLLVKIVCTVLFVGLVIGDAIVGRVYLKYLCSKDGGIVINETIELGPEYFDENGSLLFDIKNNSISDLKLANYRGGRIWNKFYIKTLNIGKRTIFVLNVNNKKIISKFNEYVFFGGWLENISPGFVSSCPNNISINVFLSKTFVINT